MTSGRPDYTVPVSIDAYTIEVLPIDISAQSVGDISIDIAAQSVGNLDINIAASAVTLDINLKSSDVTLNVAIQSSAVTFDVNIKTSEATLTVNIDTGAVSAQDVQTLINAGFELGEIGWKLEDDAEISTTVSRDGSNSLKLPVSNSNAYAKSAIINPPIPTNTIEKVTVWQRSIEMLNYGGVSLNYDDGTHTDHTLTPTKDTWELHTLTPTADKALTFIEVWWDTIGGEIDVYIDTFAIVPKDEIRTNITTSIQLDINIAAASAVIPIDIYSQTVTMDINLESSDITLDINIAAQEANVDVDIKAQTVDLNIKTSGGANIVIDKLTQTAYTERRSTISNNGALSSYTAPTGNERRGKFFPRGCRGFINTIDLYCKDNAAAGGTITVYLSPHPSMGYLYSADVTVPAGGTIDWRSATFNKMWNYDSLFIFIKASSGDMMTALDAGTSPDWYSSSDAGATWTHDNYRLHARVVMKGETIGDLPVSGTLNTIEIPQVLSDLTYETISALDGGNTATLLDTVNGVGAMTVFQIRLYPSAGAVLRTQMHIHLIKDGSDFDLTVNQYGTVSGDIIQTVSPVSFTKYDNAENDYGLVFNFQVKFKQSLKITIENTAAAGNKLNVEALIGYELQT